MLHCARQNNFGCTQHLLPAALTLHSSLSKSSFTSSSPSQFNILKSCVQLRQILLILPKFCRLIIHGQDKSWAAVFVHVICIPLTDSKVFFYNDKCQANLTIPIPSEAGLQTYRQLDTMTMTQCTMQPSPLECVN